MRLTADYAIVPMEASVHHLKLRTVNDQASCEVLEKHCPSFPCLACATCRIRISVDVQSESQPPYEAELPGPTTRIRANAFLRHLTPARPSAILQITSLNARSPHFVRVEVENPGDATIREQAELEHHLHIPLTSWADWVGSCITSSSRGTCMCKF